MGVSRGAAGTISLPKENRDGKAESGKKERTRKKGAIEWKGK